MANPHRGELLVTLDGVEFTLRPDFEAIAAIDDQLGSVLDLAERAINHPRSLTLRELAVVVCEGIKAHGRATGSVNAHSGADKVKRMIFNTGIPLVVPVVIKFLGLAMMGGQEPGNAPAPEAETG